MADGNDGKAESEEARRQAMRPRPTIDLAATEMPPPDAEAAKAGAAGPPPPPETAPRPGRGRGGWAGHLAAAIVGAAIAVAAIWALAANRMLPSAAPADTTQAVASLQSQVRALDQRLAATEKRAAAPAPATVDATARQGVETLQQSLAALEKSVAADHAALAGKASAADVAKLAQQARAAGAGAAQDADLGRRLGAAEAALSGKASAADVTKLGQEVAALQAAVKTLGAGNPGRAAEEARAAATLAAVAALDSALDRGAPFQPDLADIQRLFGDQDLGPLKRYAATGAPPLHALASRLAADLAAAPPPPLPNSAGVIDRLYASLRGLVRVTPVEPKGSEPSGNSDAAKRARVIARLDRGDYRGALQAWQALDPAARKATQAEQTALADRLAADQRLGEIGRQALAKLAGAADGGK
jgi:hypothetical protein